MIKDSRVKFQKSYVTNLLSLMKVDMASMRVLVKNDPADPQITTLARRVTRRAKDIERSTYLYMNVR